MGFLVTELLGGPGTRTIGRMIIVDVPGKSDGLQNESQLSTNPRLRNHITAKATTRSAVPSTRLKGRCFRHHDFDAAFAAKTRDRELYVLRVLLNVRFYCHLRNDGVGRNATLRHLASTDLLPISLPEDPAPKLWCYNHRNGGSPGGRAGLKRRLPRHRVLASPSSCGRLAGRAGVATSEPGEVFQPDGFQNVALRCAARAFDTAALLLAPTTLLPTPPRCFQQPNSLPGPPAAFAADRRAISPARPNCEAPAPGPAREKKNKKSLGPSVIFARGYRTSPTTAVDSKNPNLPTDVRLEIRNST
ncbi:hypothetical protein FN846DRAFT_202191 [Sphaerosporella brunnea]|uniref:Uncharacterized protein n=1 Tax=Sphaerosporella brunnea TaxID=1250544 RepID=A0A5J5F794_9PEZI|nr:hypothetical protein FN846DRAFT_202191 [Sphaerosporella brunnea]